MEMYADPDSRGGVLEPEGTVEIRFRSKDLVKAMHRCDNEFKRLKSKVILTCGTLNLILGFSTEAIAETSSLEEKAKLETELREREAQLMPMYHQVALSFADLHDTPVRMYEKGCITEVVPWRNARQYFYWSLKRRLLQNRVKSEIQRVISKSDAEASSMIRRWFVEHSGQHNVSSMFG